MSTFAQGLEVTGIGMALVFLSLLIVAGLIWALGKVFPASAASDDESDEEAHTPEVETVMAEIQEEAPSVDSSAQQAAAIAVALVRLGVGAPRRLAVAAAPAAVPSAGRVYPAMPWERPAEMWGDDLLQGETVTVVNVDPGSGNWQSQGRLASME